MAPCTTSDAALAQVVRCQPVTKLAYCILRSTKASAPRPSTATSSTPLATKVPSDTVRAMLNCHTSPYRSHIAAR
ncbi:hypothetical protein D3C72_2077860 [compost metagenome]